MELSSTQSRTVWTDLLLYALGLLLVAAALSLCHPQTSFSPAIQSQWTADTASWKGGWR